MDRYYTPEPLARDLLERCSFAAGAARVVDPSCGGGALLSAAEDVLGTNSCVGIDLDRSTIRSLRRTKPHWNLSVANLLCERSVRRSTAGKSGLGPNVLLLNPPFSQAGRKFVEFHRPDGRTIRAGQAMRFLLQAVELFKPTDGVFAIVPESLVFSELDAQARDLIGSQFEMREIGALKSTAFRGARVRSIAVELRRGPVGGSDQAEAPSRFVATVGLERGALPVHLARQLNDGVPFVHSSDLLHLVKGRPVGFLVEQGRVCREGWALLLPRVGVPKHAAVKAGYFARPMRLSDCVMALWCQDRTSAEFVEKAVLDDWDGFTDLYRGTGARYVTVARLGCWLANKGIRVERL